jgi:hypothetical protein
LISQIIILKVLMFVDARTILYYLELTKTISVLLFSLPNIIAGAHCRNQLSQAQSLDSQCVGMSVLASTRLHPWVHGFLDFPLDLHVFLS